MLSYQHGYHAGNFADVHKHLVLTLLLTALNRKSKPWSYLETHSGRGLYPLDSDQALKRAEFKTGIGALWSGVTNSDLNLYLDQVRQANPQKALECYPGSPMIAAQMAREEDRLHLMELHPQEVEHLRKNLRRYPQVGVHQRDGYEGVLSLLPPKPNRGLVLVDPAYELKQEYTQVVSFVKKALALWPNGTFVVWYPLLSANRWQALVQGLGALACKGGILNATLEVTKAQEFGMYGSGMLVVNPPWKLDESLRQAVPELLERLNPEQPNSTLEWLRDPD